MKEHVDSGGGDSDLLGDIAQGSRECFQRLYHRYAGRLLGYVLQVTGDRALAEEVVRDVFIDIWLKASTYRPEQGAPVVWIYVMTRTRLVDHWRRRPGGAEAARPMCGLLAQEEI